MVLDDLLIDNRGPRSFEDGQDKGHHGDATNNLRHDGGLSTTIDRSNRGVKDRALAYRLRKWHKRTQISNGVERNMAHALSELKRISSIMHLNNDISEEAARIYKRAVKKNIIRGRSIEGVVVASLYAACRRLNVPRTLDEFAASTNVGRKEIGRTYRFMTRQLKIRLMPTKPEDYAQRFCSELGLSGDVFAKTMEILRDASDNELTSGRGPTGVAAASIYISSILLNERRTQKEVADVAGVTEVTIRNRYKELTSKLGIEVNL